MEVTSTLLKADLRALADVRQRDSACETLAAWVVEGTAVRVSNRPES